MHQQRTVPDGVVSGVFTNCRCRDRRKEVFGLFPREKVCPSTLFSINGHPSRHSPPRKAKREMSDRKVNKQRLGHLCYECSMIMKVGTCNRFRMSMS